MKLMALPALVALATVCSTSASAATLQYVLSGNDLDGTVEFASFQLDSNPQILANNYALGEGFRVKFVPGLFQYGSTVATLQDLQFFSDSNGGGFFNLEPTDTTGDTVFLNIVGPQLYSGPEATPTLLTGSFTVFDAYSSAPLSLMVTEIAAVPEPATWGLLIMGVGAVGSSMRRHRKVKVSYV